MMRSIALVVGLLLVAGCVQPTTPQQTAQLKSLAIVTGFGEEIELNFAGLSGFSNRDKTAKVDWQIDAYFKQLAASLLNSRYQLRPVSYDPANLLQGRDFFSDPAIATVRSVVQPGTVDAVLYFGPLGFVDRSDRSVLGNGLGFVSHSSVVSRDDLAYTAWRAAVLDGKTVTILGQAVALLPFEINFIQMAPKNRTPRIGTGFRIPGRYEDFSPAERQLGKEMIFSLVSKHMPQLLTELNLR